jgi:hypothetical protein
MERSLLQQEEQRMNQANNPNQGGQQKPGQPNQQPGQGGQQQGGGEHKPGQQGGGQHKPGQQGGQR